MKYLNNKKIKIIAISLGCIALVSMIAYIVLPSLNKKKDRVEEELVITEPAPQTYLYANRDGVNLTATGNVKVTLNGKDYVIMADGSVWEVEPNGNLKRVTDKNVINAVLTKALSADKNSEIADYINKEVLLENIGLASLSDSQLEKLAKQLGIDSHQLKQLAENVKGGKVEDLNLKDALDVLDLTVLSDEKLQEICDKYNLDFEEVKRAVEKSQSENKSLSVKDFLEDSLQQDKVEYLEKYLNAAGISDITPQDVLQKLDERNVPFDEFIGSFFAPEGGVAKALENIGFTIYTADNPSIDTAEYLVKPEKNTIGKMLGYSEIFDPEKEISFLSKLNQSPEVRTGYELLNNQSAKKSFVQEFRNGNKVSQVSAKSMNNMIIAGTVINATLITGINTDLPGQITALVSQNVYDSFSATNILIPKGSRLIAT